MNKFYMTVCALVIAAPSAFAQGKSQMPLSQRVKATIDSEPHTYQVNRGGVTPVWSDDFSDANNWVLSYGAGAPDLDWQIGVGLENTGDYPTSPIMSTTADNGYAMLDSDGYANQSLVERSYMTMANPVDLSQVDNVVFQFESFYRKWTSEECYLVVSTTNNDWPDNLSPGMDISGMPNVFYVWPGMATQAVINNPTLVRINITEAAANQSQVWVRFVWTGTYGYSWFVDDASIIEQPANDIVMNSSFLSHTGNGEEYGRIPASQLNETMLVGTEVYNFGYDEQTGLDIDMEVFDEQNSVVFSWQGALPSIFTTDTAVVEDDLTLPVLAEGLYRGVTSVTSDQEQGGNFFSNNTHLRNFRVTDALYSLDGVGQHPDGYQALGSIGTNSFEDGADGLMIFAYYEIVENLDVLGVEFLISSASVAGAGIIASMHDSTDIRLGDVGNSFAVTDFYDLTQEDVDNGAVRIFFDQMISLPPGGYYAALELFSGDNTSDIRIINDLTVPQPSLASMIYIPDDDVYTNGNAIAVRLLLDETVGIDDAASNAGFALYPNPTSGLLNLTMENGGKCTVEVFNVLGESVLTSVLNGSGTLDLSGKTPGVYMVRLSDETSTFLQRVVLN